MIALIFLAQLSTSEPSQPQYQYQTEKAQTKFPEYKSVTPTPNGSKKVEEFERQLFENPPQ